MLPQTIIFDNDVVTRLDGTNTFLVHSFNLLHGSLYSPTIFVNGIEESKIKFDFYKAYKNNENVILHCEYRNELNEYKLIIHTQ